MLIYRKGMFQTDILISLKCKENKREGDCMSVCVAVQLSLS